MYDRASSCLLAYMSDSSYKLAKNMNDRPSSCLLAHMSDCSWK